MELMCISGKSWHGTAKQDSVTPLLLIAPFCSFPQLAAFSASRHFVFQSHPPPVGPDKSQGVRKLENLMTKCPVHVSTRLTR
ncbi:hypothetical protein EVAR_59875_1 [Eumeta japonica]|uniref:Uncharacterized protein n=1 Tax=Eumeta variegata TaxID=151549 RepID=A0A4C1XRB9_EUMVA|nr:hypothetical protein EVAR_59875_1 [Eumeta japonica]